MKRIKLYKPYFLLISIILLLSLACGSSSEISVDTTPASQNKSGSDVSNLQPTSTVVEKPLGSSRSNPAPVGSEITADDMVFVIVEVIRPADRIVAEGNMFNSEPEPNKEYIFIKIKVTCQKSADDKCSVSPITFKLVNPSGNITDSEFFIAGVTGILESTELFGGASIEGYVPFLIEKQELKPILMYDPLFIGDPFYLLINQ